MSFIADGIAGKVYAPGYFLAHEECERKTRQVTQAMATTREDGAKYVKMGTVFPSNDANAEGIVYEDVDVTTGAMPASVVLQGVVYEDRLPVALASAARTALTGKGFTFVTAAPTVTRPNWTND